MSPIASTIAPDFLVRASTCLTPASWAPAVARPLSEPAALPAVPAEPEAPVADELPLPEVREADFLDS